MSGYRTRPTAKPAWRRPPRRLAACGHWIYSWQHREKCGPCQRDAKNATPPAESFREFRQRLKDQGLLP